MKQKHVSHPRMLVAAAVAALYAVPAVVVQAADIKVDVTGSNIKRSRGRRRAARSGDHPRGHRHEAARTNAMELLNFDLGEQQRRQRLARQRHRRDDVRATRPRRCAAWAARPRWCWSTASGSARFAGGSAGRRRREPRGDPVLGDRARRGAEGRRVGGVRHRRDRRRDQLHHASGLPRREATRVLRRADAQRRRRPVRDATGTAGFGDLGEGPLQRLLLGRTTRSRSRSTRGTATSRSTSYLPDIGLNTTSGNTFPGFISTGGIGNLELPGLRRRAGRHPRRRPLPLRSVARTPASRAFPRPKQLNFFGSARFQINADWQAY